MKISIFIDDDCHIWHSHHDIYRLKEDQEIYFELSDVDDEPRLFIEDHELILHHDEETKVFRTTPSFIFRESFGLSTIRIHCGELRVTIRFDILVKRSNAQQIEDMIVFLTEKHSDIIRICLSRAHLTNSEIEQHSSDPETLLNSVETFIETLIGCRLELQHHLRKRLIPIKQPAWKASQANSIDPFDIIFNLDALEPVIGEGDVLVNGRSFSITEVEITTLEPSVNVEENAILLGGLYSMRRIVSTLLIAIKGNFINGAIKPYSKDYISLNDILLRITSSCIKERCETQLVRLEEFIRYFETKLGIRYQGERRPIMTPFVRAVRVYRRLFEQIYDWYNLGEPSLEAINCLVKLRSVSKIYEFVALFKIIDYLYIHHWTVKQVNWSAQIEFIPDKVIFERDNFKLTLSYEQKIVPYSEETKHLDLVDMKHANADGEYNHWCPDFVLRLDAFNKTTYVILDAKYSLASSIKWYRLPYLFEKYFMNMAVYDADAQLLKQDAILGIIALFPDKDYLYPVYMQNQGHHRINEYVSNWEQYGLHKKLVRLPIVAGISILPKIDQLAYQAFDKLFDIAERQLNAR